MKFENLIAAADSLVFAQESRHLTPIEEATLGLSLEGYGYKEIAKTVSWEESSLRDAGATLWKILSRALNKKVSKRNVRSMLELHLLELEATTSAADAAESESDPAAEEPTEQQQASESWEEVVSQAADLLKEVLPYSPLFRLLTRLLGIDPKARIKPIDRHNLVVRVEEVWIHQYLPNSLSQQPMLLLDLENRRSLLSQYRNIAWENPQDFDRAVPLPAGTQLIEQFNSTRPLRRLLILGAPGSGKTVALLELLQALLKEAQVDTARPIPVVFNLSTYGATSDGKDFTSWLVTQLEDQYGIAPARGRRFVESQKLLLMLDGLDEVRPSLRSVCMRRINEFLRTYERTECVVCSRLIEYANAPEKLQLEASLKLQPLMPDQAVSYLEKLPESLKLRGLIEAVRQKSDFQKLAETPLVLNVMAVAYQSLDISDLKYFESLEDHRRYLYDVLINRLLNRRRTVDGGWSPLERSGEYPYSQQQILDWLVWLAKHMVDRDQTVFYIEQLQPGWLDTPNQRRGYRLNSHALIGTVIGVISGCHMTPLAGWQQIDAVKAAFLPLLLVAVGSSILASFSFAALRKMIPQALAGFLAAAIYVAGFASLAQPYMSFGPEKTYLARLSPMFIDWLGVSLFWSLMSDRIVTVHRLVWSWSTALRFTLVGLVAYFSLYLPTRYFFLNSYQDFSWLRVLSEPVLVVLLAGGFGGISSGTAPSVEAITVPNQGIRKALRNASLMGFTIGPVGMAAAWHYAHGNPYEFAMIAIAIGMGAAMVGGQRSGQVLIQHFALRSALWGARCAPWNYARFLDFSVQRMFLRRAGGGYLFMHRSLMEHLAEKAG